MRPDPTDALTYEPYFGLTEKAFSLIADARFVFESPTFGATRDSLLEGIRRREGMLVLTGEIGTGKTTLCRAVLRDLRRKTYSSLVPDPFATREDLLKMLLIDFGVLSIQELTGPLQHASRTELSYLLAGFLESLTADAHAVVIIDEAQNVSMPLIEETRILADTFGAEGRLQIVFVGQPELHAKLKLPEMRQVDQRVCGYHRLAPMSRDVVDGYLRHRLYAAGSNGDRELFPDDVVDALHRRSGGVPRLINRVCDRALQLAYERRADGVTREILDAALVEVGAATLSPTWDSIVFSEPPAQPLPAAAGKTPARPTGDISVSDDFFTDGRDDTFKEDVENWLAAELAVPTRSSSAHAHAPSARRPETRRAAIAPKLEEPARPVRTDWPRDVRSERYIDKLLRVWMRRAAIVAAIVIGVSAAMTGYSLWAPSVTIDRRPAVPDAPSPAVRAPAIPETRADALVAETVAPAPVVPAIVPAAAVPAIVTPTVDMPAPAPAPAPAAPVARGDYFVAVGLFASRDHADQLVDTLGRAGLPAMQRTVQLGERALDQIVLGPFLSRADASADLKRLQQLGGFGDARVIVPDARR